MPFSLRFLIPLGIALAAIAYAVAPLVDRLTLQWFVRDLEARSRLIATTFEEPVSSLIREGSSTKLARYFNGITKDEQIGRAHV